MTYVWVFSCCTGACLDNPGSISVREKAVVNYRKVTYITKVTSHGAIVAIYVQFREIDPVSLLVIVNTVVKTPRSRGRRLGNGVHQTLYKRTFSTLCCTSSIREGDHRLVEFH